MQRETVSSDTFFPTYKSSRGNTCSRLFMGTLLDMWIVYPSIYLSLTSLRTPLAYSYSGGGVPIPKHGLGDH